MSIGNEAGEYSYKVTSVTLGESGSDRTLTANCEGDATGYANVFGTLTLIGFQDGNKVGQATWIAMAGADGTPIVDNAPSIWTLAGENRWRVRAIAAPSNGAVFAGDGELDLNARTFKGTLFAWD